MNIVETQTWLQGILPVPLGWHVVQFGDGPEVLCGVADMQAEGGDGAGAAGSAEVALPGAGALEASGLDTPREILAVTANAAEFTEGLIAEGLDVRVEFATVGLGRPGEMEQLLAAAVTAIAASRGTLLPQPGTFLPGIGHQVNPGWSTPHGLLVSPFLWNEGVPQTKEPLGDPHVSNPGRYTLIAQVILLTQEEYIMGLNRGIDALQEFLAQRNTDVRDLTR